MNFYAEPAFFLMLIPIVAIAVVLGMLEKPLARYGCIASVVMLALLFSRSIPSLVFFVCYLALSFALAYYVMHLFRTEHPQRVARYRIALALQIAPLAVYKVGVLFEPDFLGFIGISYITFKTVQVLIETRDGLIDHLDAFEYFYFLVFFPTITSGPILRSRAFVESIEEKLSRDGYLELLYRGAGWFVLGALYKFVAAAIAQWLMWFVPSVIGADTAGAAVASELVYAFAYSLYLFFDFAGYSHMAVGLGFALGVRVPTNFKAPFLAVDIKDFWNRWHITLSYWLRDFVFMRVARSIRRHKVVKSRVTASCIGYMCNMGLMGVWHGITPGYIAYGLYHGILLSLNELYQRTDFYKKHKDGRIYKVCSWAVTMILVMFGFALFSGQVPL